MRWWCCTRATYSGGKQTSQRCPPLLSSDKIKQHRIIVFEGNTNFSLCVCVSASLSARQIILSLSDFSFQFPASENMGTRNRRLLSQISFSRSMHHILPPPHHHHHHHHHRTSLFSIYISLFRHSVSRIIISLPPSPPSGYNNNTLTSLVKPVDNPSSIRRWFSSSFIFAWASLKSRIIFSPSPFFEGVVVVGGFWNDEYI